MKRNRMSREREKDRSNVRYVEGVRLRDGGDNWERER